MKIRIFDDGEPVDVAIEGAGESREVVVTAGGESKRFRIATITEAAPAGAATVDGRPLRYLAVREGSSVQVAVHGESFSFDLGDSGSTGRAAHGTRNPETRSPMPGKVLQLSTRVGAKVSPGDPLLILEAMKMENVLCAEIGGTVAEIHVAEGDMVEPGKVLVVVRPED